MIKNEIKIGNGKKQKMKNEGMFMKKIYKEPDAKEIETTINVLYSEKILSIYTNKVNLQRQLNKIIGEPKKELKVKRSIVGSIWEIPLEEKSKIAKMLLKANIYEL